MAGTEIVMLESHGRELVECAECGRSVHRVRKTGELAFHGRPTPCAGDHARCGKQMSTLKDKPKRLRAFFAKHVQQHGFTRCLGVSNG